jgi:multicomponent K+:H+ antiporter subunit G
MSLLLLLSLPWIGSMVAALLPTNARNLESSWSAAIALAVTVQLAWLYPQISAGEVIIERLAWIPSLGIELVVRVDGFAWMFAEIVIAVLLLASGVVAVVAALGLWRLADFFQRMHAPALASTLAAWLVTFASIIHFSTRGEGLALHVWLIIIVLSITAPVTTIMLARAALFRRRLAGDTLPPPLQREDHA